MAPLPPRASPTIEAILSAYEVDAGDGRREHLGASAIGRECDRALWYEFRWITRAAQGGRILRLFETGRLEEERLVRNLRRIGVTVLDVDPDTGRQWSVQAHGGHFGGSLDGVGLGIPEAPGTWHVLEFKTHNAKSFAELKQHGVRKAKPEHWAQMQVYMHLTGLTRALYRLDSGMLHTGPDALFDDIAFEVSVRELIDEGYLAPLISKQTSTQLDVSGVGTRGGEFIAGQLEATVDQDPITRAAIDEVVAYGRNRRSWLLFCAGVGHAQHVCDAVREHSFSCATIFGHTPKAERDRIIAAFKRGDLRALASMGVLTTGFNAPGVDLIAMLRPTKSTGLYVQMAGRGTRLAPGKENCLVLDFAGNVARHGPIDLVKPRDKLNGEGDGEAPTRVCPECQTINALAARVCIECGYVFPAPEVQLEATATTRPILSTGRPEWVDVEAVTYHRHEKLGRPPSLRVDYHCGLVRHREWVCLEHEGYAGQKAVAWWRQRDGSSEVPATVDEALARVDELHQPVQIAVRPNGRYTEVVHARFA